MLLLGKGCQWKWYRPKRSTTLRRIQYLKDIDTELHGSHIKH